MDLLTWIIVGLVAGVLAGMLVGGVGLVGDIIVEAAGTAPAAAAVAATPAAGSTTNFAPSQNREQQVLKGCILMRPLVGIFERTMQSRF